MGRYNRLECRPKVRIVDQKSLDLLLGAFNSLLSAGRNEELAIIGDGPYLQEVEEKYPHSSIQFLHYRNGDQRARLYASADILAFPSENDTFGNAVVEAHASGIPVVVVNRGGPQEQVTHGVDGLVIPAGNVNEMAEALRTLLDSPRLCRQLGCSGRKRAQAMTWAHAADVQWNFYMEVWGRNVSTPGPMASPDALSAKPKIRDDLRQEQRNWDQRV